MKYKLKSALKTALLEAIAEAVDTVADDVLDNVKGAVEDYYADYSPGSISISEKPWEYKRTGTLMRSPNRSDVEMSANTATSSVYMNCSLKYSTGSWTLTDVIESADNLLHGGWDVGSGVSVWREPIDVKKNMSRKMWQKALKDAGINIE